MDQLEKIYFGMNDCCMMIVDVVCVLIVENGYVVLCMCDVVVCVGINILILYYYVQNKVVLVVLVVDIMCDVFLVLLFFVVDLVWFVWVQLWVEVEVYFFSLWDRFEFVVCFVQLM